MRDPIKWLEGEQFVWLFVWYERTDKIKHEPRDWFLAFEDVENALIRQRSRETLLRASVGIQDASVQG